MLRGWVRRRALEEDTGRAALRFAAASGARPPGRFERCTNTLERLAYLARLARRHDEAAIAELAARVAETEGELCFAARAALTRAIANARRRANGPAPPQPKRPKTSAPQVQMTTPAAPRAQNRRFIGRPPTARRRNR